MAMESERQPVPIARVSLEEEDLAAVRRVLESGWLVQGKECERFERAVASYSGAKHGIAVSSGTAALHVALKARRLEPGDEVIVPAFTWVATAAMVEHCGGTPVFCDIDLATFYRFIYRAYANDSQLDSGKSRNDDLHWLSLELTIPIVDSWSLGLNGSFLFNNSDINEYEYDRQIVSSTVRYTF